MVVDDRTFEVRFLCGNLEIIGNVIDMVSKFRRFRTQRYACCSIFYSISICNTR